MSIATPPGANVFDDLGLERTAVTCRGADDNPMSADAAVRQLGVDNNKRALDCCAAAGVKLVAGPFHSALGRIQRRRSDGR